MLTTTAPVGSVDFKAMGEVERAELSLEVGETLFRQLVAAGLTSDDKLHVRIGIRDVAAGGDFWREIAERSFDGREPVPASLVYNTAAKAQTCAFYGMNSDSAAIRFGHLLPREDVPQRWTGGVCYVAEFVDEYGDGRTYRLEIIVAASGVQGVFDKVVSLLVGSVFGACWTLSLKTPKPAA